jgi:hypothetical protein
MLNLCAISGEDNEQMMRRYQSTNRTIFMAIVAGIAGVLAYNRIPLINRVQGRWKRLFIKCIHLIIIVTMVFLPTNLTAAY